MPTDTYKNESRKDWYDGTTDKPSRDQMKLGCMQRIADATEAMAKNHNELIDENKWLRKTRARYRDECDILKRRLAAEKGAKTKLRKRLDQLEQERGEA